MWSLVVVERDPITDGAAGVGEALETLAVNALFFERPDQPFHHAVLLWAMRRDELLLQAVASDESGIFARRKNQPVVRPQKKRSFDFSQRTKPGDQGLLQG